MTIRIDNPGVRPFTAWVEGTTTKISTVLETTDGTLLWPGRETCLGERTLFAAKKGGFLVGMTDVDDASAIDALARFASSLPPIEELVGTCGIPTINGTQLALISADQDGPGLAVHFRARSGMFVFDLYFWFCWGQAHSRFTLTANQSDCDVDQLTDWCDPLRLQFLDQHGFDRAFVLRKFNDTVLLHGTNQPQVYRGVVYWPEMRGLDGRANALHMAWSPVRLFDEGHKVTLPPFRRFSELPPYFSGNSHWASYQAGIYALAGTWNDGQLGPGLYSGRTGETDGHSNDGEEVGATDVAGRVLDMVEEAALQQYGRRPDDYREHSGSEVTKHSRPRYISWSGLPHIPSDSDKLGKITPIPGSNGREFYLPNWDIPGNASPADQQHFIMVTLAAAYHLSGNPALQQMIRRNQLNLMTSVRQDLSARAVGWVLHAGAVLWAASENEVQRDEFAGWLSERRNAIIAGCWRPETEPGFWHTVTNSSRFDGHPYTTPWEYALAAMGAAADYEVHRDERSRRLAVQAGLFTVRYGWQDSPIGPLSIDSIEVDTDGITLLRRDVQNTYHTWMAAGASAVARYGSFYPNWVTVTDIARAIELREQERIAVLRANRPAEWIF